MSEEEDTSNVWQDTAAKPEELESESQDLDDDCDYADDEVLQAALLSSIQEMPAMESTKPEDIDQKKEEEIEVKAGVKEKEEDLKDVEKGEDSEALEVNPTISGVDVESAEMDYYEQEDALYDQATDPQVSAIIAKLECVATEALEEIQQAQHAKEDEEALTKEDEEGETTAIASSSAASANRRLPWAAKKATTSGRSRSDSPIKQPLPTEAKRRRKRVEGLLPQSARPRCQVHRAVSAAAAAAADSAATPSRRPAMQDPHLQANNSAVAEEGSAPIRLTSLASSSRTVRPKFMDVHIQRNNDEPLGVVVRATEEDNLVVLKVEDGLVQAWNDANPQRPVRPFDRIVGINKTQMSARKLVEAIQSPQAHSQNLLILCGDSTKTLGAEVNSVDPLNAAASSGSRSHPGSLQKRPPLRQPEKPERRYWGHQQQTRSRTPFDKPRSSTKRLLQQPLPASSSAAHDENRWSWHASAEPRMGASASSAGPRAGYCRLMPAATGCTAAGTLATGLPVRCGLCGEMIDRETLHVLRLRKCGHMVHAICFKRADEQECLVCKDPTFEHPQYKSRHSWNTGASGKNAGRLSNSHRSPRRSPSFRSSSLDSDYSSTCSRSRRRRSRTPRRRRGRRRRRKGGRRRRARRNGAEDSDGDGAKCEICGAFFNGYVRAAGDQQKRPFRCAKCDLSAFRQAAKRPTGSEIAVSDDPDNAVVAGNSATFNSSGEGDEKPDVGALANEEEVDEEGVKVALGIVKEAKANDPDGAVPVLEMLLRSRPSREVIAEIDYWESTFQEVASSFTGRASELAIEICEAWRGIRTELHPRSEEKAESKASSDEVSESRKADDAVAAVVAVPDMPSCGETKVQADQENAEAAADAESDISDISAAGSSQEQRRSAEGWQLRQKTMKRRFLGSCLEKAKKQVGQKRSRPLVNHSAVEQATPAPADENDPSGFAPSATSKSKGSCPPAVRKAPTPVASGTAVGWSAPSSGPLPRAAYLPWHGQPPSSLPVRPPGEWGQRPSSSPIPPACPPLYGSPPPPPPWATPPPRPWATPPPRP